jgi:hypothetical protein
MCAASKQASYQKQSRKTRSKQASITATVVTDAARQQLLCCRQQQAAHFKQ